MVPYDRKRSRKIFTKVNRYARKTTTGQNLVTDDEDIIAVLSREIANDQTIIGADLVKYKDNDLKDKDGFFTTLATLGECNAAILLSTFPGPIIRTQVTDATKTKMCREKVFSVWKFLVENIDLFSDSLNDKGKNRRFETPRNTRRLSLRKTGSASMLG